MRVAIVHGYFLGDSGSAIYTRELARELRRQGHDVTLVCQEQHPEDYGFIDCVYQFDPGNETLRLVAGSDDGLPDEAAPPPESQEGPAGLSDVLPPPRKGRCRLVRPDIGGRILTYVAGPFPPFEALPFQDAPDDWIETYEHANARAMTAIFERWPQDLVQANHAVLQPFLVKKALAGSTTPYVVTIHGSELNFTISADPRMVPYMVEGFDGAAAVVALSDSSRDEAVNAAALHGCDIAAKTLVVPPGVDTALFTPSGDRAAALNGVSPLIDPSLDDIAVFAGRLLWTKGLHHAVASLPLALRKNPRLRLIVVGDGPMRRPLEEFITLLDLGDIDAARRLAATEPEFQAVDRYGPVIPPFSEDGERAYAAAARGTLGARVHFTGHLAHGKLAPLFAAADISLAPSVFPEAFGLVSIEAAAAGAIPIATYQSGLCSPLDVVSAAIGAPELRGLAPGTGLTEGLAFTMNSVMGRYPTRDAAFRGRLHKVAAETFSWEVVSRRYLTFGR